MNSLGINKDPKDTRVVVAMSGGVDSSVAAALLHEQGYDVVGVTLRLFDYGQAVAKSKTCCAGQDIYDAKRVAEERGFPHYVLDYESKFRDSVIDDFADSYLRGQTPIPCVRCNQSVKFRDLLKAAHDLGADCMATGHYIQRKINGHGAELHRAIDDTKDQSYFLFATTQEQLDFLRFPLGGWTKDITRTHAERLGLANAEKPDSQDICFVPNGDYAGVVKKLRPESEKSGDIVHVDGRVLGQHKGIIHYTIGQRKGIGIGGGHNDNNDPFYVIALQPESNRVIVGPKEALARDTIKIADCNWLLGDWNIGMLENWNEQKNISNIPAFQHSNIQVKFRSTMAPVPARLSLAPGNRAEITLAAPQYGISPGQAAVCYAGGRVLGGGWIAATGNG